MRTNFLVVVCLAIAFIAFNAFFRDGGSGSVQVGPLSSDTQRDLEREYATDTGQGNVESEYIVPSTKASEQDAVPIVSLPDSVDQSAAASNGIRGVTVEEIFNALSPEEQMKLRESLAAQAKQQSTPPKLPSIGGELPELPELNLGAPKVPPESAESIGMKFVPIPAGDFLMGEGETQRRVTISKPFSMGVHEVTRKQWNAVSASGSFEDESDECPVRSISWNDAVEFCKTLSNLPAEKQAGNSYRLPTEAEWEYACRAGSETQYHFGEGEEKLSDYDWFKENATGSPRPVGLKKPNAWGLYDMHGNVTEWCSDLAANEDPTTDRVRRVMRGGYYGSGAKWCRSAIRSDGGFQGHRYVVTGFRVVLEKKDAVETPE